MEDKQKLHVHLPKGLGHIHLIDSLGVQRQRNYSHLTGRPRGNLVATTRG